MPAGNAPRGEKEDGAGKPHNPQARAPRLKTSGGCTMVPWMR
jgi:hypothetical protein